MIERKNKRWLKRLLATGLAAAVSVSGMPSTGVEIKAATKQSQSTTKEQEVSVDSEAVNGSGNYELLNNIQGGNILHCWNWSYSTIEDHLQLIAESGYTAIQTSPAQQPKDYHYEGEVGMEVGIPGEGGSGNWWKLYQPVTFNVCDNGETWLGTKSELESLCASAEKYGIKVIVDIVANHMGNIKGWQNSLTDISPQVGEYWSEEMMTDESYWHINDLQIWMSDGRNHFTQGTMGMPDLKTQDKRVQKFVYEYLDELIDCGVDGFRFDAAKHIETEDDDPSYAGDFWPTVLGEAKSHYKSVTGGDLYVYGEILNTVGDNFSIESYTKHMSVTDNSAGNHLLEAYRNNNANGLSMTYPENKSVIWAESHDTYMNESSRYASDKSIVRTWAMVGNKKDAASLYFVRPYYSKDVLEGDQDGSFKGNLKKTLDPAIMGECETYTWASNEVAAINHFNNRFASSADNSGVDGNIAYCQRGSGIILVNFSGAGDVSTSAHGVPDGSYVDEVSGNTFTVAGGTISGKIGSEYGVAVIYNNPVGNPTTKYPIISDKPVIKSSLASTTINGEKEVTFTVTNAETANYSIDGGAATDFSDEVTLTVGKDLEEGEKCVVKIKAEKAGKTVQQTFTYTMGDNKPVLTISPDDGTSFEDTLDVTISAENTVSASYQIGDGEAVELTKTTTITIGEDMVLGDSVTITATGQSSNGKEATVSVTYTKEEEDNSSSIFFKNTNNWEKVTVYAWNDSVTPEISNHAWPGEEMTIYDAANKIYSIDFGDKTYTKVIFSNNGGSQTGDIDVESYGALYDASTGKWSSYVVKKPKITASLNSGTIKEETEVTFTVTDAEEATVKVNDEAEQSFTDKVTITVGTDKKAGETDTVVVTAVNGTKETKKTFTYTMEGKKDDDGDDGAGGDEEQLQDMSSQVSAIAYEGIYDGNAHGIEVTAPEDAEISYSETENGTYQTEPITYAKAGTYTVYYKVKKTGCNTVKGKENVTIEKKEVTVSGIYAKEKQYDGTKEVTLDFSNVVVDGLIEGDQVTVSGNGTLEDENIGENKTVVISDLVLSGADANNYELAKEGNQTETTTTVVETAEETKAPNNDLSDKGETQQPSQTPTVSTKPSQEPDFDENPSSAPTSTPSAAPDADDTLTPFPTVTPDDTKKDISKMYISLSATTFRYNGKEQKPKVTVTGLEENVDYKVIYFDGCKDPGTYNLYVVGMGGYTGTVMKSFKIAIVRNSVYTINGYKYKVTSATGKTVSVTGTTKKTVTSITVKDSIKIGSITFKVTNIGSKAFASYKKLKSVTIGSNVKTISTKAFYGASNLKKITIKSKKISSVGTGAIKNINKKAKIKVPSSKYKAYKKLFTAKSGFKKTMKMDK